MDQLTPEQALNNIIVYGDRCATNGGIYTSLNDVGIAIQSIQVLQTALKELQALKDKPDGN